MTSSTRALVEFPEQNHTCRMPSTGGLSVAKTRLRARSRESAKRLRRAELPVNVRWLSGDVGSDDLWVALSSSRGERNRASNRNRADLVGE